LVLLLVLLVLLLLCVLLVLLGRLAAAARQPRCRSRLRVLLLRLWAVLMVLSRLSAGQGLC
jgi:uncharacterized protein YhhL (DUF1145 family)